MPDATVLEYIRQDAVRLSEHFKKASLLGKGSPSEISDYREIWFKDTLRKYFPFPHRIAKGLIRDCFEGVSPSIDCVMLNPIHPHTVAVGDKYDLILADGVDFVIEVKPDLSRRDEIERGLGQICRTKKLKRSNPVFLAASHINGKSLLPVAERVPCFIYGEHTFSTLEALCDVAQEFYKSGNVPISEQVDYIIVNNVGIITVAKHGGESPIVPERQRPGVFIEYYGDNTFAAMLIKICSKTIPVIPVNVFNIITNYLNGLKANRTLEASDWPNLKE